MGFILECLLNYNCSFMIINMCYWCPEANWLIKLNVLGVFVFLYLWFWLIDFDIIVLNCEIHVNITWLIMTLWDVKLWTWDLVVNECVVNTWCKNTCVLSCELYNNLTSVYLKKSVFAQCCRESVGFLVRNQC